MKKNLLILVATIALLVSSCKLLQFKDSDDPKPDNECIDKKLICEECVCTKEYAPVCGCDGVTYGNECEAKNSGVKKYTKGECGIRTGIFTYSYAPIEVDGCGSILRDVDQNIYVPESESQIPDSIKYDKRLPLLPFKYSVTYKVVDANHKLYCGFNSEPMKCAKISVLKMQQIQ